MSQTLQPLRDLSHSTAPILQNNNHISANRHQLFLPPTDAFYSNRVQTPVTMSQAPVMSHNGSLSQPSMMPQNGSLPPRTDSMYTSQYHPTAPGPPQSQSLQRGNRLYTLIVRQQPIRARMCGFGDKDRRPITPPPCIQLLVTDAATGQEIDANDVDTDTTYFVLTVDLWDSTGSHEVNLVRHSNSSPAVSISAATTTPYPPPAERPFLGLYTPNQLYAHYASMGDLQQAAQVQPYMAPRMPQPPPGMMHQPSLGYAGQPAYNQYSSQTSPVAPPASYMQAAQIPLPIMPAPTAGMFTRNLIGSLSVNAFKLTDPDKKTGFWFILQDLSVRTEGMFRLKMNFVDIGSPDNIGTLNTGKAPVLATVFSDAFQVYSAKKFPGVIESTDLSKCFAGQGIKIPIRKDGPKVPNQSEYDADDA